MIVLDNRLKEFEPEFSSGEEVEDIVHHQKKMMNPVPQI